MDPKREIIRMAVKLFEEKGYHGCSVQDIVEPLGLTKGAFYYYFKGKEELLYYIHDEMITYLIQRTEELFHQQQYLNSEQVLFKLIENVMLAIHNYKSHVVVFFQERRYLEEESFQKIRAKRDYYSYMVLEILKREMERGGVRKDLDVEIVMFGLFGMCNWAYQWYRQDERLSIHTIIDVFYRILKEGLIPK